MWDVFKDWIFDCIAFFANFLGDWGLAIIVITVIFRLLVAPIMHKQIKSTFQMQKVQPLMQEIQKKFADDPVRQNEEMQKLYAETKFNPLAGCVPMLIQMPIFLAMFQTLREIGYSHPDEVYSFYGMVSDLTKTPANVISDGFGAFFPYLVLMLVFVLVVIVEDRPVVLALRTVRETLARAALHDHADDQAQHQADADQASDAFRRLEKKMVQLGNIHVGLVASSEVACCGSLPQPHKHNVNQYTAHTSREDSTFGEGLGN